MARFQTPEQKAASLERKQRKEAEVAAFEAKMEAERLELYKVNRERTKNNHRENIQTPQLLHVLQQFALGLGDNKDITPTRLKAIEVLLGKSMPDLASLKHEVDAKSVVFLINTDYTPPVIEDESTT